MNVDTLTQNTLSLAPSLFAAGHEARPDQPPAARTLVDLMHDGFYLLLLLKNRYAPQDADEFSAQVIRQLDDFERNARRLEVSADDVYASKYAFCAAVDEIILSSDMAIREKWERSPLQLTLFGEQLAGENFYTELDEVRRRGDASVQTLEVFYMCLLIGFQGKYMLDGKERLHYLIATLDKEITHLKGKRARFAPHWRAPDNIRHAVKADIPMWVIASALACFGVLAFAGLNWVLARQTNAVFAPYYDVIKLAPAVANITISLP